MLFNKSRNSIEERGGFLRAQYKGPSRPAMFLFFMFEDDRRVSGAPNRFLGRETGAAHTDGSSSSSN